jgi:hypothetical protein
MVAFFDLIGFGFVPATWQAKAEVSPERRTISAGRWLSPDAQPFAAQPRSAWGRAWGWADYVDAVFARGGD